MKLCALCQVVKVGNHTKFCPACRLIVRHKTCPVCQREFDAKSEKALYCYKQDCESFQFPNNTATRLKWIQEGRPVKKEYHHDRKRTTQIIPTGRKCQICRKEICRVIKDGIVAFDGRYHCLACESHWEDKGKYFNMEFMFYA